MKVTDGVMERVHRSHSKMDGGVNGEEVGLTVGDDREWEGGMRCGHTVNMKVIDGVILTQ